MSKPIIIKRRTLKLSDFRKRRVAQSTPNIILVEGDGYINVAGLEEIFPDRTERNNYIKSLIEAMG